MASPEAHSLSRLTLHSEQATSQQSAESASCPFFEVLPLEIRRKIYEHAFEGSVMHITDLSFCCMCEMWSLSVPAAGVLCCGRRLTRSQGAGAEAHNVLLTCSSMYYEARSILAASIEVRFRYCSAETLASLPNAIHKHSFLEYAAPYVKHVIVDHCHCDSFTNICKIFTDVQLISFGTCPAVDLDVSTLLEDGQYDAEHARSIGRMVEHSASGLNESPKDSRDDLHVHFHYHRDFFNSRYRLVYDLTSDIVLAEHIEPRESNLIGMSEDQSEFEQKVQRQLLSAIRAGAMKDGREQRIEHYDCGRSEGVSAWTKGLKIADFCDELL